MNIEALPAGTPESIFGVVVERIADVGLVLLSAEGLIQWANSEGKRVLGMESRDPVGTSIEALFPYTDSVLSARPVDVAKDTDKFETELICQDGIRRTVEGRVCQLPSGLFLLQLKDITTHKRSVEEF